MTQVFLLTSDISDFVVTVPKIPIKTGEYGQTVINEISSITGLNNSGFWTVQYPGSPFYGASSLTGYTITIIQDGVTLFVGGIKNIRADDTTRLAEVALESALQRALAKGCEYLSDVGIADTPALAAMRIAQFYGIPVDTGSFGAAHAEFNLNAVYITVNLPWPTMSVMDVFQSLADIGVARIYAINGTLYYDTYNIATSASVYTFSDERAGPDGCTIMTNPIAEQVEKDATMGFSIDTVMGRAFLGSSDDPGKSISAGTDSPIRILSRQAGNYIGLKWLAYLNRPQTRVQFGAPVEITRQIPINAAVELDYLTGFWAPTILDTVEIDNTDKVTGYLTGVSR